MPVHVVDYSPAWPVEFERVADVLRSALGGLTAEVEHVGSTSVPGLPAKPILDIDVIVNAADVPAAIGALTSLGYVHRGDLGVAGREAFFAPDAAPARHVYVCERDSLSVRNHLTVRDVLRARQDLREKYAAVKLRLAADPSIDMTAYIAGKSEVLQEVLATGGLTAKERAEILGVNVAGGGDPSVSQVMETVTFRDP